MSSTNIKTIKLQKSSRSFSISERLTILSILSGCLILFFSAWFLYWNLKTDLENKNNQFLIKEISKMQTAFKENPIDWNALEIELKNDGVSHIRVTQNEETIIAKSKNEIIAAEVFPPPQMMTTNSEGIKWRSEEGKTFLLMSSWLDEQNRLFLVQLGVDISPEEALINDYRYKILIVFLIGVLFSTIMNVVVVRNGLRPLKDMTRKVHQINAAQLHERIHSRRWPRELSTLATAFDEMLNRLEDSFNRLSQFSVNLAHELRTPINNLMGEAQVALSKARTPEEYMQVLGSSLEEYSRLSRMIENLLFLARAENKEIKPKLDELDAHQEIQAVIEFYEAVAQEQGVKVSLEGNAALRADPILFRRLINNLLSNALQYTSSNGAVHFSVQNSDEQSLDIQIRDTGLGIDPNDLPHIFDRFYRSPAARQKYPQGMGLGLYIVQSIMQLHGGVVTVQSQPSQGTTFTLKFPRNTPTS